MASETGTSDRVYPSKNFRISVAAAGRCRRVWRLIPAAAGFLLLSLPLAAQVSAGAAAPSASTAPASAPAAVAPMVVQGIPMAGGGQAALPGPSLQSLSNENGQMAQDRSAFDRTGTGISDVNAQRVAAQRNEAANAEYNVPTEFQQLVWQSTGRNLPIFGASLFSGVPSTFAPVDQVPVNGDYVLGPGDEVTLQLAGQVNQTLRLTVDRNGAIAIPGVGPVTVAGLRYSQLTPLLNQQIGRLYRNFTLSASLGRLRSIQVFVVGRARRPGTYSISSLSTLLNAIFASGGPAPNGSVRDIQVRRNGQTIDHFDLYDLLLRGDKTHDIQLANGDVIFFPFVGPQIAITGSVDVPAIYELKGETTVADALAFAGGETALASHAGLRLDRVSQHTDRAVKDLTLAGAAQERLQNGDIVSVASIVDRFQNAVTLRGNVANPGRYRWHPGMHLSELFPNKEALVTREYWRKRDQLGQRQQDYVPAMPAASAANAPTEGALQVRGAQTERAADVTQQRAQTSSNTGGSSVGAALTSTTGLFQARTDVVLAAPDIDWNYAVIDRQNPADLTTSLVPFNLGKLVLEHDPSQDFELQAGDIVTVFSKADLRVPSSQQTRFVRLEGEFVSSGVYSVLPGETLRQLVRRAGGFTPEAYLYASEFTRESTRRVEQQRLNEYADELEAQISAATASARSHAVTPQDQAAAAASAADADNAVARLRRIQPVGRIVLDLKPSSQGMDEIPDIALEDGDRFVVPRVPSNVTVEGQVYSANAFVYSPQQRVVDYLRRAGGPDRQADRKRIFVLRADGSVVSRQYNEVYRAPIYPGDTIVVPPILDRRTTLQRITDIASIVGNLGLTAGVVGVLAR